MLALMQPSQLKRSVTLPSQLKHAIMRPSPLKRSPPLSLPAQAQAHAALSARACLLDAPRTSNLQPLHSHAHRTAPTSRLNTSQRSNSPPMRTAPQPRGLPLGAPGLPSAPPGWVLAAAGWTPVEAAYGVVAHPTGVTRTHQGQALPGECPQCHAQPPGVDSLPLARIGSDHGAMRTRRKPP